ncbi:MAG: thiamine biosynthesis protein ThiS [Chloroflexi bacterium]|nr:thiamine biosynthesis protein ThiS [Chloroflexota bacterium]|tara:strand:+ start:35 stop:235 length:201 start_codon:yes stop_codon:yes gene_type:complete
MITINNEHNTKIVTPLSINDLIKTLDIKSGNIAVAVNEKVIRKSEWGQFEIHKNDIVDIVRAVGGG